MVTPTEFASRLNHLAAKKYSSSSKVSLTAQGPAKNIGGVAAQLA